MNSVRRTLMRYCSNIDSLREYVGLYPVALERIGSTFDVFLEVLETGRSQDGVSGIEQLNQVIAMQQESAPANQYFELFFGGAGESGKRLKAALEGLQRRSNSLEFMLRSALIILVSHFELLLADIFHHYYRAYPDALGNSDKQISYSQLVQFKTIEEAADYFAAAKVEALLREDLDGWADWFRKDLKIDLRALAYDWGGFAEAFLRRNLYVHNDGVINRLYLLGLPDRGAKTNMLGSRLSIDQEYIDRAIDQFTVAGITLVDSYWWKTQRRQQALRDSTLLKIIYQYVLDAKWKVVEELCQAGMKHKNLSESDRLVYLVNYWLAVKRQGGWDTVRGQVQAFDIDACSPYYAVGVLSLLEDRDRFFSLLPAAVHVGVTKDDLEEWPILEEMRGGDQYQQAVKELFPEVPISDGVIEITSRDKVPPESFDLDEDGEIRLPKPPTAKDPDRKSQSS